MVRYTTEEFIRRARLVHGDKYNYDKVVYISSQKKVEIVCPIHGGFFQKPSMHLQGQGCPFCKAEKTGKRFGKTQEAFLQQATEIHGSVYDYSKVQYKGTHKKVNIICNQCGREFLQTPHNHLGGQGCPWCSGLKKDRHILVRQLENIYGDKYIYENVSYVNTYTPVKLVCRSHGLFEQTPKLLLRGHGCAKCSILNRKMLISKNKTYTQEDFLRRSHEVHGNKYIYTKAFYTKSSDKVCIICPEHGEFLQIAGEHMQGTGCPKCKGHNKSTDEFKEQLKKVHGDTYILDKVEYINTATKVCMVCKEHGDFFATPSNLLSGQGCPMCYKHKGEERVEKYLKDNNIKYSAQHEIPNESILIPNKVLRIDFYLQDINTFIEYNGGQHYFPVEMFGGQEKFERQQERDYALRQYCREHKIKLIEISYKDYNKIEEILEKELKSGRGMRK